MKSFRDPLILLVAGIVLSAIPFFSPNQAYVLTLYGINTHLRVEYAGWIAVIIGAIWLIATLLGKKTTAVDQPKTVVDQKPPQNPSA